MADAFRIEPTAETRRKLDDLMRVDIDKDIRREINAATQGVVREIRSEILSQPSKTEHKTRGRDKEGLRVALAKAVRKRVRLSRRRTQVMIELKHGGLANLARAVEGEIEWSHPTYGQDPRVSQTAWHFWWPTIARMQAALDYRIRAAVERALARARVR